ncbi:hypothetical protein DFQ27_006760 [Actinomortierella ambigua]|uniref:Uncharacterized protein n=1 Tax=Actinomortierella ambigua TaxID=1343610 RepID=A0A9P6PXI5_9FUNG|nr:hypothetical protein DFQ27_006760 [Actinomortierella ambigua]
MDSFQARERTLLTASRSIAATLWRIHGEFADAMSQLDEEPDLARRVALTTESFDERILSLRLKHDALQRRLYKARTEEEASSATKAAAATAAAAAARPPVAGGASGCACACAGGGGSCGHSGGDGLPALSKVEAQGLVQRVAQIFHLKSVPVRDMGTLEIAWERVKLKPITPDYPQCRPYNEGLEGIELFVKIVLQVQGFLKNFEKYYSDLLKEAFPFMAYRYMSTSLMHPELKRDYAEQIQRPEYAKKDWDAVQRCIDKVLRLTPQRFEIFLALLKISRAEDEDVDAYADRAGAMVCALDGKYPTVGIVYALYSDLSIQGRDLVDNHFGSVAKIARPEDLLDFIRTNTFVYERNAVESWLRKIQSSYPDMIADPDAANDSSSSSSSLRSSSPCMTPVQSTPRVAKRKAAHRKSAATFKRRLCRRAPCLWKGKRHAAQKCWSITRPGFYGREWREYQAAVDEAQAAADEAQAAADEAQAAAEEAQAAFSPPDHFQETRAPKRKRRRRHQHHLPHHEQDFLTAPQGWGAPEWAMDAHNNDSFSL